MVETIRKYFSELPDPRHRRGRRHRLDEMIIMAILAVICSADSWQEVAHFARAKEKWLRSFLELPHGVPSHDTFGRVFSVLEPEAFERCFLAWIGALAQRPAGGLIAVDGKTLRHSFDWTHVGLQILLESCLSAQECGLFRLPGPSAARYPRLCDCPGR